MLRRNACLFAFLAALPAVAPPPPSPVRFASFEYRGSDATFDRVRPGEYANPILAGFYPYPSVIRVGADFYLVPMRPFPMLPEPGRSRWRLYGGSAIPSR